MKKVGTLKELDLKPGDVVEWNGRIFTVRNGSPYPWYKGTWASCAVSFNESGEWISDDAENCRIVSRASDKPKLWRDMTDAEKGALLLAYHEGKVIESCNALIDWEEVDYPGWHNCQAYRVRPEPEVEVIELYGNEDTSFYRGGSCFDTHCITFNLVDGEIDCSSVQMRKLSHST